MWSKEVSVTSNASKEQIWKLWSDVTNWHTWDEQVISSKIKGHFDIGQTGELNPKDGPKSNFTLVEVTPYKSFTSRSNLPFSTMDFIHEMKELDGVLTITHKLQISGIFTFLFSRLIGNKLARELPRAMHKLSQMAKNEKI